MWQKYPYYGQDTSTLEDSCVEIWWAKSEKEVGDSLLECYLRVSLV